MEHHISAEKIELAKRAISATPSYETFVRELGEQNARVDQFGNFEIVVTDPKKMALVREMLRSRNAYEQRMAEMRDPERPLDPFDSPLARHLMSIRKPDIGRSTMFDGLRYEYTAKGWEMDEVWARRAAEDGALA